MLKVGPIDSQVSLSRFEGIEILKHYKETNLASTCRFFNNANQDLLPQFKKSDLEAQKFQINDLQQHLLACSLSTLIKKYKIEDSYWEINTADSLELHVLKLISKKQLSINLSDDDTWLLHTFSFNPYLIGFVMLGETRIFTQENYLLLFNQIEILFNKTKKNSTKRACLRILGTLIKNNQTQLEKFVACLLANCKEKDPEYFPFVLLTIVDLVPILELNHIGQFIDVFCKLLMEENNLNIINDILIALSKIIPFAKNSDLIKLWNANTYLRANSQLNMLKKCLINNASLLAANLLGPTVKDIFDKAFDKVSAKGESILSELEVLTVLYPRLTEEYRYKIRSIIYPYIEVSDNPLAYKLWALFHIGQISDQLSKEESNKYFSIIINNIVNTTFLLADGLPTELVIKTLHACINLAPKLNRDNLKKCQDLIFSALLKYPNIYHFNLKKIITTFTSSQIDTLMEKTLQLLTDAIQTKLNEAERAEWIVELICVVISSFLAKNKITALIINKINLVFESLFSSNSVWLHKYFFTELGSEMLLKFQSHLENGNFIIYCKILVHSLTRTQRNFSAIYNLNILEAISNNIERISDSSIANLLACALCDFPLKNPDFEINSYASEILIKIWPTLASANKLTMGLNAKDKAIPTHTGALKNPPSIIKDPEADSLGEIFLLIKSLNQTQRLTLSKDS